MLYQKAREVPLLYKPPSLPLSLLTRVSEPSEGKSERLLMRMSLSMPLVDLFFPAVTLGPSQSKVRLKSRSLSFDVFYPI